MKFTDTKWESHASDYYFRGSYDKEEGGDLFHYATIAEIRYDAKAYAEKRVISYFGLKEG